MFAAIIEPGIYLILSGNAVRVIFVIVKELPEKPAGHLLAEYWRTVLSPCRDPD